MGTAQSEFREGVLEDAVTATAAASDLPLGLVATKLAPPVPVPDLLARTGLVAQLTPHRKLCLISAPAGWGKTSLLAAWHDAESGRQPFAFPHLEPTDDDAPILWTYIIAALRTVRPELMAGADEVLRAPGVEPMRRIVPSLVNELCEIDDPMVLVLDDYHVLTQEPVHASILYLIDHLPPTVRLVIATRADPPLPLGRLRASGGMTEVRAAQLRFSEEEATRLLEPVRFHRRSFRLSPVTLVKPRPNLGNTEVFRVPEPVRLLVRPFFYRSFYRVPRVGNPKGEVVVKSYVAKKGDRWYAAINEGLASRPGT